MTNRKERRAAEAVARKNPPKGIDATAKGPPTPVDAMQQRLKSRLTEVESSEKLKLIISGKVAAPNQFVQYLAEKYREERAQFDGIDSTVRRLEEQLERAKAQRLVLEGSVNKYLEDVTTWLERHEQEKNKPAPKNVKPLPVPAPKPAGDEPAEKVSET